MKLIDMTKKLLLVLAITTLGYVQLSEARYYRGGYGRHYGGWGRGRSGGWGLRVGFGPGYGYRGWGYPYGYGYWGGPYGYRRPYYYGRPVVRAYPDNTWAVENNTNGTLKVYVGDRIFKIKRGDTKTIRRTSDNKMRIKSMQTGESKIVTTTAPFIQAEIDGGLLEISTSS